MSFRERLGGWIAGSRASTKALDIDPMTSRYYGTGAGNQPDHAILLRESLGTIDTATRAIANRVASLEPLVKRINLEMPGTETEEIIDDHPLKDLLDRPHPDLSRFQLLRLTTQWIVTVGEAYWLKVGTGFGVPGELHPIPPQRVTPRTEKGVIVGYRVEDGNGAQHFLRKEEVIRIFLPDPENVWTSEGYFGPVAIEADAHKFASQHVRSHFQFDATPKAVLEAAPEATMFDKEQWERFKEVWRATQDRRSGTALGIPPTLPLGFKFVAQAIQNGAEMTPLLEYLRDDLLMALGTPRSVLGQVVSGDRSSAETTQWGFDLHTVLPIARLISDSLTLQLAPDFEGDVFVDWEPFVADDQGRVLAQEQSDLDRKVLSINEVREERGLDPVEWGELPIGSIADTPYTGEENEPLELDDEGAFASSEDDDEPEEGDEEPRALADRKSPADLEWARVVARERKFVPTLTSAVQEVLEAQRKAVTAAYRKSQRGLVDDLFDALGWDRKLLRRMLTVLRVAFKEAGSEAMAAIAEAGGPEKGFQFTEVMAKDLEREAAVHVSFVNRTTRKRLARLLADSATKGESVDKVAQRIGGLFGVRKKQARTVARTELLRASQAAQLAGFQQSGVVPRKQWNTSRDANVRDSHVPVDGVVVRQDEAFILGDGEPALAPGIGVGGGGLSAANTVNCRCFITPVVD